MSFTSPPPEDRLTTLGSNPLTTCGWMLGGSILAMLAGPSLGGFGGLLFLGGLFMAAASLWCGLRAMFGTQFYKVAHQLVATGQFTPTWIYRSFMCAGGGILMVDEPGQRVHLGGDTFGFADIKQVTYTSFVGSGAPSDGEVSIVRSSGTSPVRVLRIPRADVAQVAHRLANCIGGVEATIVPHHRQA
ncbi:hypothetical protein UAJ10_28920 [Nitrospirillum sp. BR 11164]|uniref:hypothetical protein n=1 Tax=Nitrospirillum sp. BR 11164 TaxID=3104324 RepID=UPI002AFF42B3|nr:hypothetical protein [Nitrospirillum sp. BR 11164]MEA1653025.1 hypothetical protein [Nitrospirillum sp. BR 11164]